jgi:hypothetical protein
MQHRADAAETAADISDRAGRTTAQSRDARRSVGQMWRPAVLERLREANDGIPVYDAFLDGKPAYVLSLTPPCAPRTNRRRYIPLPPARRRKAAGMFPTAFLTSL